MSSLQMEISFHVPERKQQVPLSRVPIDESFPEREANELAQIESFNKHLFRPNTYLHKWWARRAGTTFRFILKQLVTDASLRDYYAAGGLEGITILDPMMGGGTTLHEAIRLGANVIGCDLDPIPVLQFYLIPCVNAFSSLTPLPNPHASGGNSSMRSATERPFLGVFVCRSR